MHKYRRVAQYIMLFAALAVFGSLTGCVAYANRQWFGGQRDVRLENGTIVSLWLRPSHSNVDIPLVAYYSRSSPPYTIQAYFRSVKAYRSVDIEGVVVRYSSGFEESRSGRLRRVITSYEKEHGISLSDSIFKDVVTRHEDCRISIKGRFITSGGKTIPYVVTKDFKAQGGSDVAPYWKAGD